MTPEEKIVRQQALPAERTAAKKRKLIADYVRFKALYPGLAALCNSMKAQGTLVGNCRVR